MAITLETTHGLDFPPSFDPFPMNSAEEAFRQSYPSFENASLLDDLRRTEYARLDEQQQVYLDYTGGGLYAESQLYEHMQVLSHNVFGNPHSTNPTSQATTNLVEHTRNFVLKYFNASPDEYTVIFTANATAALKIVGESYPFALGGRYVLTCDNHNSVNGIREFARAKGCTGYLVYLFQKSGTEQACKNHITTCLVSRLHRTGTARTFFDALVRTDGLSSQYTEREEHSYGTHGQTFSSLDP